MDQCKLSLSFHFFGSINSSKVGICALQVAVLGSLRLGHASHQAIVVRLLVLNGCLELLRLLLQPFVPVKDSYVSKKTRRFSAQTGQRGCQSRVPRGRFAASTRPAVVQSKEDKEDEEDEEEKKKKKNIRRRTNNKQNKDLLPE
jgi:hypothetical protein